MELSLKKLKKERLTIELPDGRKITIKPPKYKTLMKFSAVDESFGAEEVPALALEILNMNAEKIEFTEPDLDELFDLSDIYALLQMFTGYMTALIDQKN